MSDLIRRGDVLDALIEKGQKSKRYEWGDRWELNLFEIKEAVESVPSVEPEWKTGKWIPVDSETVNGRCSVCGYESHLYENDVYGEHYCPNCGARLGLT